MATLHALDIPDELYAQLQELAKAENNSVETQAIKILHQALQKIAEEQEKRKNVLKILEENRLRRENLRTDVEWPDSTALIR